MKHHEKLEKLKRKIETQTAANADANRRQELSDLREQWYNSMVEDRAETTDHPSSAKVPIYGKVEPPLDKDDLACLELKINFTSFGKIDVHEHLHEQTSTQTNYRWSRLRTGSPD